MGDTNPSKVISPPAPSVSAKGGKRNHIFQSSASKSHGTGRRILPLHLTFLLLYSGLTSCQATMAKFSGTIGNVTVTAGRDASLSCTVEDLGEHKVGWIHLKRQMIVAVHTRMISRISRYSVTHDSHKTWTLHITGVTEEDGGYYMCQINTDPALSQVGLLQVVVPPNIVDETSSMSEIQVREKADVSLKCSAKGSPEPRIMWKREDGDMIVTNTRHPAAVHDGPNLVLKTVNRMQMGSYLCIASNGVPPSVSKRITLQVEFPPQIHVPNQLIGVPTGDNVTIECFIEAYPRAITYWVDNEKMILNSIKYHTDTYEQFYKIHMKLTITNFNRNDTNTYQCVAKNSLGETEGDIKLNEIYIPPKAKEIRSDNSKTEEDEVSHNDEHHVIDPPRGDPMYRSNNPGPQPSHPDSNDPSGCNGRNLPFVHQISLLIFCLILQWFTC